MIKSESGLKHFKTDLINFDKKCCTHKIRVQFKMAANY